MTTPGGVDPRVRVFGSAVVAQGLLSAASLLVALVLIRGTTDNEYGYFVLVQTALLLLAAVQGAFLQPPLVLRMTRTDDAGRAALVGGAADAWRRVALAAVASTLLITAIAGAIGLLAPRVAWLVAAATAAGSTLLLREFHRMLLLAYREPGAVLRGDLAYVVVLVALVLAGTLTAFPAIAATMGLAAAALVSGVLLGAASQAHAPWRYQRSPGILREFAPIGIWSVMGSATHWAFSQGASYVTAGVLDVAAVAALAATRLTLMPVNVLSAGIGSLMMPTASLWLQSSGPRFVLGRLLRLGAVVAVLGGLYFAMLWLSRDWVFGTLMGKDFADRDLLLLCWGATFLVTVFRDQLLYLPGASGLFRPMAFASLGSAVIALAVTALAIRQFGLIGAPLGVLVGELLNLAGLLALSLREVQRQAPAAGS